MSSSSSSSSSRTKGGSTSPSASTSPNKKRRFVPPAPVVKPSSASDLLVLHQQVDLHFVFSRPTGQKPFWSCEGRTSLYVLNQSETPNWNVALHLRRTCHVQNVSVETVGQSPPSQQQGGGGPVVGLHKLTSSYEHYDPLAHVLVKPPQSFTEDDLRRENMKDADSQCTRGAQGMTNGLRIASVASNMGGLRISISDPSKPKIRIGSSSSSPTVPVVFYGISKEAAKQCWRRDLVGQREDGDSLGEARLRETLEERSRSIRENRTELMTEELAKASTQLMGKPLKALKITVDYKIEALQPHLGGIHISSQGVTPHVYTTAGVVGDHEGPRSWLPCLDSASYRHRPSWEMSLTVTSPLLDGLHPLGAGQDFGVRQVYLHDNAQRMHPRASECIGSRQLNLLQNVMTEVSSRSSSGPHVIPPDADTVDSILATAITCVQSWTPCPARSMGFAIGPFRILEDPEYFSAEVDEEDGVDEDQTEEERKASVAHARTNGEGIRQAYFAPIWERKHIHSGGDMTLLPGIRIALTPPSAQEEKKTAEIDATVTMSTVGVPHRALSLMRDILAVPAYRTVSYTQIWIPNAVHGGFTCGALHLCPEVLVNAFTGGAIMDSRTLPSVGYRLPFYAGGRALQFLQARSAIRGWITSALPLGGVDDVGNGYLFSLIEQFLMSLYARGYGAQGEGGAKQGFFFTKRYALGSGLNSSNLDFLPVSNIEETELSFMMGGIVGTVPVEERNNDVLWRSSKNGTESRTSSLDEYNVRQLLYRDIVETVERGTEKDKDIPSPSMGWFGSSLSLTFLSSNATSSSLVGAGAVELAHPVGGLVYRALKTTTLAKIVEARAGKANFVRTLRAGFIAAHLRDLGEDKLKWEEKKRKNKEASTPSKQKQQAAELPTFRPPFVVCVDELMKKNGFTHNLLSRSLRILAGGRDANLRGTQVDIERDARSSTTRRHFVTPEGFPNSFVRGASSLYLRVGVHVESSVAEGAPGAKKGIQLQILAEPVIPEGSTAFGGPITIRLVENEGQLREFSRSLPSDGSRCDFGPIYLHAKPVTTTRQQTTASGSVDGGTKDLKVKSDTQEDQVGTTSLLGKVSTGAAYTQDFLHKGGYQAIELVRLTNLSPLLWVRIDPHGVYGGRISVFQPDACLAEQLFHDGDACCQVETLRSLAERPLRIQGAVKIAAVYDVAVSELPVRLMGDCVRGSPALYNVLPHTPAVRAQAALTVAQWQNNKAPISRDSINTNAWIGVNLLIHYFEERFFNKGIIVPVSFSRSAVKSNESEMAVTNKGDSASSQGKRSEHEEYHYIDNLLTEERNQILRSTSDIEVDEDEEYRVRMAAVTSIGSVRAKDGQTPSVAVKFLETLLAADDGAIGTVGDDGTGIAASVIGGATLKPENTPFVASPVFSEALFAACHVNVSPAFVIDPATGKAVQSKKSQHPIAKLLDCCRRWVDWELYRETIRSESESKIGSGVGNGCHDSAPACAIAALSTLTILRQCTTVNSSDEDHVDKATSAQFYIDIFDEKPRRSDSTRAACAQAVACICCAADREESSGKAAFGLLTALEFLLDRILDETNSPGLRQTLALLTLDTCTGKVCSSQRVASIAARSDICVGGSRFFGGPLGPSNGNDNGSAILTSVSEGSHPAAYAVNNGARRGLRLLTKVGHPREESSGSEIIVRAARLATNLWRTINGDTTCLTSGKSLNNLEDGVCSNDGLLRCTLLALWQWIWPKQCFAVMRVQTWKTLENSAEYRQLGAHLVMKATQEEKEAAVADEAAFKPLMRVVESEIDRQKWRGEMAQRAYEYLKEDRSGSSLLNDPGEQGVGEPLPPVQRDNAFKQGGWLASTAQQRRALALDGGTAVTKIRLSVTKTTSV